MVVWERLLVPYYLQPKTLLAAKTYNLNLSPAVSLGRYQFAHFFKLFLFHFYLGTPASRDFLQIAGLWRLKKADFSRANKHAALLDLAVKAPKQAVKTFVVFFLDLYH